jgi:hypothetical protein
MPAGATYEPIATQTLASAAASITFSSIPATYTDLKWVLIGTVSSVSDITCQFNGDTASNYSWTGLYAQGSVAGSNRQSAVDAIRTSEGNPSTTIPFLNSGEVFSYSGSTYKTQLTSWSGDTNGAGYTRSAVGLWRSTAAISSISISPAGANFKIGTTATLYGIKAA